MVLFIFLLHLPKKRYTTSSKYLKFRIFHRSRSYLIGSIFHEILITESSKFACQTFITLSFSMQNFSSLASKMLNFPIYFKKSEKSKFSKFQAWNFNISISAVLSSRPLKCKINKQTSWKFFWWKIKLQRFGMQIFSFLAWVFH